MFRIALPRFAAVAVLALPASFALAADPYCSLPGVLVSEDAAGDATAQGAPDPVPGHDVLSVHVSEPAEDKIVFTLTVDATPAAVPNVEYFVNFTGDDGIERYASYSPYPLPGDPSFEYGHTEPGVGGAGPGQLTTDGTAGAESSADPTTGTITIWLPRTKVLGETVFVDGIYGEAQALVGAFGTGLVTPVDDSPQGLYEIRGTEDCSGKSSKSLGASLMAGSFGLNLLAPLALLGLRRRRATFVAALLALSGSALAADPASGTVSPESPTLDYVLPLAPLANVSGLTGLAPGGGENYECTEPQYPCDEFELTVTIPDDFLETYPDAIVRIAAATDNDQFDIDMQVKDAATDKYVATVRDNPPEQPTAKVVPKAGTTKYIVQVAPGTPHTGGTVKVTLDAGDAVKSGSIGMLAGSTGLGTLLALAAGGLGRRFRRSR